MLRTTLISATLAAALVTPPLASETLDIADISGAWEGEGFVQRDDRSEPVKVRCSIEGRQSEVQIGFEGSCRAMLIMKRDIGADIVLRDGQFVGTYKGSRVGIADLNGTMTAPNQLDLTMTFPRAVNGDDQATMRIERPDEGTFKVTTVDRMESGVDVTTAQITFERR